MSAPSRIHPLRPLIGAFLLVIPYLTAGGLPAVLAQAKPPAAGIATAHPLATQAGHEILEAGGNAFDAAVAITAALAVVEPYSSGIGGGGFWLLHRAADGREIMIDGRERAPLAAHRDMYLDADGEVIPGLSIDGPLAAGIPGVPAAMVHLARHYGHLSLTQSLAPAIRHARDGFPADAIYRRLAGFRLDALRASPAAAEIFLADGAVPEASWVVRQPDLARTLESIAARGFDGFYRGRVAERLVNGVREGGGIWSLDDLADYGVKERAPIRGEYRGARIVSAAPPSSGGVALVTMLNILAGYDIGALDEATRTHLLVEAMRRAYRDRAQYLGDPDHVAMPLTLLIRPEYAAGLRAGIRADRATPSALLPGAVPESSGPHTTHFSVLDTEGNRVAATLSINYPFGSGFVAPGTGVLLNDEMDDFSSKPGTPNVYGLVGAEANAIAPGKRMLSSMTPTFVETDERVAILGTPGGSRIITMVLLGALEFIEGGSAEALVEQPRFHHQFLPDVLQYEPGALDAEVAARLQDMGHSLKPLNDTYGNLQAVIWDRAANRVTAASDPRGIGQARVR